MAERSKALVLGTSLLGGVGSNPTPINATLWVFFFGAEYSNIQPLKGKSLRVPAFQANWRSGSALGS